MKAERNANATKDSLDLCKWENASLTQENDSLRATISYQGKESEAKGIELQYANQMIELGIAQHNQDKKTIKKQKTVNLVLKALIVVESVAIYVLVLDR